MHLNRQGCQVKFSTRDSFARTNADTINLIDEADYFLIDNKDFSVPKSGHYIGMTATTFKEGSTTVEKTYLETKLEVKIFDTLIDPIIKTAAAPTRTTISEFLRRDRCDWAKMIYCPGGHASYQAVIQGAGGLGYPIFH